jgi:integrase
VAAGADPGEGRRDLRCHRDGAELAALRSISGHVFRVDRASGPVWYAKYRLPDGRQVQKKIAPAWTRPGRPDRGFVNRRGAEAWLADVLAQAHAGTLPGMVRTGTTFSVAATEWLRYCVEDRACKPSTMVDYRHTVSRVLVPIFGPLLLEDISPPSIEVWRGSLTTSARTRNKQLTILKGIFRRAHHRFGLQRNPVLEIERMREPRQVNLDVFSPEVVMALVRAADSEQDAAIYLTAAFTGLRRGELIALRWRDVDFPGCVIRVRASYAAGSLTTPSLRQRHVRHQQPPLSGHIRDTSATSRMARERKKPGICRASRHAPTRNRT